MPQGGISKDTRLVPIWDAIGYFEMQWLASLRVLRTERITEIRCFQEVFALSNVNELMLKVA